MPHADDSKSTGSVPENYDRYLGRMVCVFAEALVRIGRLRPFRTPLAALVLTATR